MQGTAERKFVKVLLKILFFTAETAVCVRKVLFRIGDLLRKETPMRCALAVVGSFALLATIGLRDVCQPLRLQLCRLWRPN